MLKLFARELLSAIKTDPDVWGASILLTLFQPKFVQIISGDTLSFFALTESFASYFFPTIIGCLLAVYKSRKPIRERWTILAFSMLFNGYILESLLSAFKLKPTGAGFFIGGAAGYYLIEFMFAVLEQAKPKGVPLVYRFLKNKADAGANFIVDIADEIDEHEHESANDEPEPEKPKRGRKPNAGKSKSSKNIPR